MAIETPICDFGWKAPKFELPAVDGLTYTLDDLRGERGTLIMFICNHCPYVQAVIDRIVRDACALQDQGIGVGAIMSNDWSVYPDDAPEHMVAFYREHEFCFPYMIDENQQVAQAYQAVCTPDFFGFDANLGLQFRGRLDASRKEAGPEDARRELFEAMMQIAETGNGPVEQIPSMGCSIKWREAA